MTMKNNSKRFLIIAVFGILISSTVCKQQTPNNKARPGILNFQQILEILLH